LKIDLDEAIVETTMNQSLAHQKQQRNFNNRHRKTSFNVGDTVKLMVESVQAGQSKKFQPLWKGPFIFLKRGDGNKQSINNYNIRWEENPNDTPQWVNVNRLENFYTIDSKGI
jgi:ribosomal protein L19